jgi:phosphatidylserine decarboxylase
MSRIVRSLNRLVQHERLNFLLTNRIPRRWATLAMGRLSRIENPLITKLGLSMWRLFAGDFRLHEAKRTEFRSLYECFTRELRPGARPIDGRPQVVVSPCDGVVGCCGAIKGIEVLQAKGYPYTLPELLGDSRLVEKFRDGIYVTLRLKSNMYHRFHAPLDGSISKVVYISGDTWNVNPIALKRIERLYCKNERAILDLEPRAGGGRAIALVPVAAILVASIKLNFLDEVLDLKYRGPNVIPCAHAFRKGEELGYFRQGSTIVLFASEGYRIESSIRDGQEIKMGQPLLREHSRPDRRVPAS